MDYASLTTPDLLLSAARKVADDELSLELRIRAARLGELEHQAQPTRNDLAGRTPADVMAFVNAPSVS